MNSDRDTIIGIDPDCKKSGVAILFKSRKAFCRVESCSFHVLLQLFESLKDEAVVVLEGGWLNESNWHMRNTAASPAKAAAMGRNVGMNHQTGLLLVEMCASIGIPCEVVKPLRKGWSGPDRKITAKELEYFTGWSRRTNQDARDAALLAWVYAGLPVRVKVWREE